MVYLIHSAHNDFLNELYSPIKNASSLVGYDFYLPHEEATWKNTKDIIKEADLVIAEVTVGGTGIGIELGWANAFNKPIIAMFREETECPRSVKAVTERVVPYNQNNLVKVIEIEINKLGVQDGR